MISSAKRSIGAASRSGSAIIGGVDVGAAAGTLWKLEIVNEAQKSLLAAADREVVAHG